MRLQRSTACLRDRSCMCTAMLLEIGAKGGGRTSSISAQDQVDAKGTGGTDCMS